MEEVKEPRLAATVAKPKRARRKKSRRPHKGKGRRPEVSERMKALWADPEWRAKMTAIRQRDAKTTDTSRKGVPDGMRKKTAMKRWAQARASAEKTMAELEKAGVLDDADSQAREALHYAITVMRGPMQQKDGLAAARLVLEYTKAKPASKTEMTISKAEEWLTLVTSDNEKANQGDAGGAEASPF